MCFYGQALCCMKGGCGGFWKSHVQELLLVFNLILSGIDCVGERFFLFHIQDYDLYILNIVSVLCF